MTDDVDVLNAAAWRRNTWNTHLERHAFQVPDGSALVFEGDTQTWSQLRLRVALLAGALRRRGVGAGDRVVLLMTNRSEFLEVVLATTRVGAIAVPVNFRSTPREVAHVLEDAEPKVVLTEGDLMATAQRALEGSGIPLIVAVARQDQDLTQAQLYEDVLEEGNEPEPLHDVPEEAPALLMYTSGTTGRPKGAVLTHANLQAQALTIVRAFGLLGDAHVNLCASPLFHVAGLGTFAPLLLVGGCTVIMPSRAFSPSDVLDAVERHRVTTMFLVPSAWQSLCADPTIGRRNLTSLRTIRWGAAPASTTLLRRMAEVFSQTEIIAVFGQTEMSPVTCVLEGGDALRKLGSVGRPIPTLAVQVVNSAMQDVPQGEVGEIVYRGPTQMLGYWRNPTATAEAFAGGWFHSGDLVRLDEEGFVYIVDRAKDMIISGGENVYCAEVEEVLAAHPSVAEVSVIGRPHPRWGETPVAVLVLASGAARPDLEDLRQWLRGQLAAYKIPTAVEVVDALPHNASGKVVKALLREGLGGAPQRLDSFS